MSSQDPKPRPLLAKLVWILAIAVAALTVGSLLWDFIAPAIAPRGTPAAQAGFKSGIIWGTLIRTVILSLVATYLVTKARELGDPVRFGPEAVALAQLAAIARSLDTFEAEEPSPAAGAYAEKTSAELVDVFGSIKQEAAPERYNELVLEIRRRVHASPADET